MPEKDDQTLETKVALLFQELDFMNKSLLRLELKIDQINTSFATVEQHKEVERRVKSLESWNSWLTRIIIGEVLIAVLSLIIIDKI